MSISIYLCICMYRIGSKKLQQKTVATDLLSYQLLWPNLFFNLLVNHYSIRGQKMVTNAHNEQQSKTQVTEFTMTLKQDKIFKSSHLRG